LPTVTRKEFFIKYTSICLSKIPLLARALKTCFDVFFTLSKLINKKFTLVAFVWMFYFLKTL
jgi:hypothetical protein